MNEWKKKPRMNQKNLKWTWTLSHCLHGINLRLLYIAIHAWRSRVDDLDQPRSQMSNVNRKGMNAYQTRWWRRRTIKKSGRVNIELMLLAVRSMSVKKIIRKMFQWGATSVNWPLNYDEFSTSIWAFEFKKSNRKIWKNCLNVETDETIKYVMIIHLTATPQHRSAGNEFSSSFSSSELQI